MMFFILTGVFIKSKDFVVIFDDICDPSDDAKMWLILMSHLSNSNGCKVIVKCPECQVSKATPEKVNPFHIAVSHLKTNTTHLLRTGHPPAAPKDDRLFIASGWEYLWKQHNKITSTSVQDCF